MKRYILSHIAMNKKKYTVVILIVIIGIISGILIYRYCNSIKNLDIKTITDEYLNKLINKEKISAEILLPFYNIVKTYLLYWLCGLVGIGTVAVPIHIFIKGFICGFTSAHMIYTYSMKGFLFNCLIFSPHILFYFPAAAFSCVCIFSYYIKTNKASNIFNNDTSNLLMSYSLFIFFASLYSSLGLLFDKYLITRLLTFVAPSML